MARWLFKNSSGGKMKSVLLGFFALVLLVPSAHADYRGWIAIDRDRELFVDFIEPKQDQPIVVIANGLTQDIHYWNDFADGLKRQGFGVLRWDMMGQLASLKRYGKVTGEILY